MQSALATLRTVESRSAIWGIAAIVLAAVLVRLALLQLMLFDFDEGIASIYALQFWAKATWPTVGVKTSFDFYNPPLFIYLLLPPYGVSKSPLVASAYLQLLGMLGVTFLCWQLRRSGLVAGSWAALLLGLFAPGPMLLGQRLWGHALIVPLGCVCLAALLRLMEQPRSRWASATLPLSVCAAQQVHFSGALYGVSALVVILLLRLRLHWRAFGVGVAAVAVTLVPYLIHVVESRGSDFATIGTLIFRGSHTPRDPWAFCLTIADSLFDFHTYTAFLGNEEKLLQRIPAIAVLRWVSRVELGIALIAGVAAAVRIRKGGVESGEPHWAPLGHLATAGVIMVAVPAFVFLVGLRVTLVPAYYLPAFPGLLLLVALLAQSAPRRLATAYSGLKALAAVVIVLGPIRTAMLEADPTLLTYPPYRDLVASVQAISLDRSPAVTISSEQLPPERGLPYQFIYLLAMINGDDARFRPTDARRNAPQYVIHVRSRPAPPAQRAGWPYTDFGLIRLFRRLPMENSGAQ